MGLIKQISSGSPSALRGVSRRPLPSALSSLSIVVLQRWRSEALNFAFDEIILADALKKQKLAIQFPAVRNKMRGSWRYLIAASHLNHALIIGIARTDGECTVQNEIVIRTLTVAVPRDELAGCKREDTRLDVRSNDDRLDLFDGIIWLC